MSATLRRDWRCALEDAIDDVLRDRMASAASDVVEAVFEIDRDHMRDTDGEQRQRIFGAALELLNRFQGMSASDAYRPSIYAVAQEFQLTAADVLFLQKATGESRKVA